MLNSILTRVRLLFLQFVLKSERLLCSGHFPTKVIGSRITVVLSSPGGLSVAEVSAGGLRSLGESTFDTHRLLHLPHHLLHIVLRCAEIVPIELLVEIHRQVGR